MLKSALVFIFLSLLFTTASAEVTQDNDKFNIDPEGNTGLILKSMKRNDIIEKFGKENIKEETIWLEEGTVEEKVFLLYPGKNEIQIRFDENNKIKSVNISSPESQWNVNGITTGLAISELTDLNGNPFEFYGFGWDYGGTVTNWNEGKFASFNENVVIRLGFDWETAENKGVNVNNFMGDDKQFSSDDISLESLESLDLKVEEIIVEFK